MADLTIIKIAGTAYKPSVMDIGIQDVSAPDAGRDLTGTMHPMKIGEKQTVQLEFWEPSRALTKSILSKLKAETFPVQYYDPEKDELTTKTMYVGDRQTSLRVWGNKKSWYGRLSFKLIEI